MNATRPIVVKPNPNPCECGHDLADHRWSFAYGATACTACSCTAFRPDESDKEDSDAE